MSKKKTGSNRVGETKPRSQTHARATFYLDRKLLADLRSLVGELKARAMSNEGKVSAAGTMSDVAETALKAEIERRKKLLRNGGRGKC